MPKKKALLTGITGQDGSYLSELLLSQGYEVHGIIRRASTFNTNRIDHLYQDPHTQNSSFYLHYGDLTDGSGIGRLLWEIQPDEIYHLGAQSHVRVSFDMPEYTAEVCALGTLKILEAIRSFKLSVKFYNAASSEMFGLAPFPQNERTPFYPASPYAISKIFAYHITRFYREAYGIFACNGILFNHESPRRGETFVTRKIVRGIARIKAGLDKKLYLGNLDAKRDWGYAPEYVEAMYQIMQQKNPSDWVIATGETHTVFEFLKEAFRYAGIEDWESYIEFDPRYVRPIEVAVLIGDATRAKEQLSWTPSVRFMDLVHIMMDAELRQLNLPTRSQGDAFLDAQFPQRWWRRD